MSAALKTSARLLRTLAPFAAYSASGKPASMPAPASITTSIPALERLGMTVGTNATRRSPGYVSRGTPTIMNLPPFDTSRVAHTQNQQCEMIRPAYPKSRISFEKDAPENERSERKRRSRLPSDGAMRSHPSAPFPAEPQAEV